MHLMPTMDRRFFSVDEDDSHQCAKITVPFKRVSSEKHERHSSFHQPTTAKELDMPCTATRDKSNPRWNDLLDHVNKLNDQLVALANFHLGDDVKPPMTDEGMLFRATNSIADACLEVTDATCVVAATMRSIICKHVVETKDKAKKLRNVTNDNSHLENKVTKVDQKLAISLSEKKSWSMP